MPKAYRIVRLVIRMMPKMLGAVRWAGEMLGWRLRHVATATIPAVSWERTGKAEAIRLSAKDQRRFAELLLDPPPLSPAMERALEAHRRLVRYSEP